MRQNSHFGVTHCEYSEVQIAVFLKRNMLWKWKLVQRFTFCLSSTLSVNKNSENLAILTVQFDDGTVKTIYTGTHVQKNVH